MIGEQGRDFSKEIINFYMSEDCRRWKRLCDHSQWSFLDLYFQFTSWARIIEAVGDNSAFMVRSLALTASVSLLTGSQEAMAYQKMLQAISITRALHMDTGCLLELREHLRLHKDIVRYIKSSITPPLPRSRHSPQMSMFMARLDLLLRALDHYERLAETNMEHLHNLLSLVECLKPVKAPVLTNEKVFNTETVEQGRSMARLSALAFIFIPLSFVAVSQCDSSCLGAGC